MATYSTQPSTLAELRVAFLNSVKDVGSNTAAANGASMNDIANSYLNRALMDMHTNPNVMPYWAIRRGVLITHAPYSDGTISITAATSRTAVVGASTLWNTAVSGFGFNNARAGGKIKFSGLSEIYEVSGTPASDTAMTLASVYTGADLSAATYTYFEDEYALVSDFLKPADARLFSTDLNIPFIGPMEFRRRYPRNDFPGKPRVATMIQLGFSSTTTPRQRIVLSPYPNDEYSIPYDYVTSNLAVSTTGVEQVQMTSDTDEPIIPIKYRMALIFQALTHWYRDEKDDARSQEVKGEYTDLMQRMMNDVGTGQRDYPKFVVRTKYGMRRRRGRYSYNSDFDSILDR